MTASEALVSGALRTDVTLMEATQASGVSMYAGSSVMLTARRETVPVAFGYWFCASQKVAFSYGPGPPPNEATIPRGKSGKRARACMLELELDSSCQEHVDVRYKAVTEFGDPDM